MSIGSIPILPMSTSQTIATGLPPIPHSIPRFTWPERLHQGYRHRLRRSSHGFSSCNEQRFTSGDNPSSQYSLYSGVILQYFRWIGAERSRCFTLSRSYSSTDQNMERCLCRCPGSRPLIACPFAWPVSRANKS